MDSLFAAARFIIMIQFIMARERMLLLNKLHIAVCDCDKAHAKEIDEVIHNILFDECEYVVDLYSSSVLLCKKIEQGTFTYDVVFLEVDLDRCTGLDIAGLIRNRHYQTEIVFITGNRACIREGYKFRAFDYLIKPVSVTYMCEVMHRLLKTIFISDTSFCFKNGRETYRVRLESVSHFFSKGRIITVTAQQDDLSFYGKLDDLEKTLPSYMFLRTHQSFVVNLDYITSFNKDYLILKGEVQVPVSRKYAAHIEDAIRACKPWNSQVANITNT